VSAIDLRLPVVELDLLTHREKKVNVVAAHYSVYKDAR
jgi:hypothetical protein